mmetsp:Transcript_118622/g.340552  ORF Transcript_118622/g.340552 Transcript_118622/m.340552 type:complete len:240 (+) Transcript_118622:950-1669(+)
MGVQEGEEPVRLHSRHAQGFRQTPELVSLDLARAVEFYNALACERGEELLCVRGDLLADGAKNSPVQLHQQHHRLGIYLEDGHTPGASGIQGLPEFHRARPLASLLADLAELLEGRQWPVAQGSAPSSDRAPIAPSEVLPEHGHRMTLLRLVEGPLHEVADGLRVRPGALVESHHDPRHCVNVLLRPLLRDEEAHLFEADLTHKRLGALHDDQDLDATVAEQRLVARMVKVSDVDDFKA